MAANPDYLQPAPSTAIFLKYHRNVIHLPTHTATYRRRVESESAWLSELQFHIKFLFLFKVTGHWRTTYNTIQYNTLHYTTLHYTTPHLTPTPQNSVNRNTLFDNKSEYSVKIHYNYLSLIWRIKLLSAFHVIPAVGESGHYTAAVASDCGTHLKWKRNWYLIWAYQETAKRYETNWWRLHFEAFLNWYAVQRHNFTKFSDAVLMTASNQMPSDHSYWILLSNMTSGRFKIMKNYWNGERKPSVSRLYQ